MTPEQRIDILKKLADYYGISKNVDFARFFGLSEPTAFNRLKVGYIDFEQVYEKCPDISADWLLSGEGPMLKKDRDSIVASQNTNIGEGANQNVSVVESKAVQDALAALAREQEALSKAQDQISGLIEILKGK